MSNSSPSIWTRDEDKLFEIALLHCGEDTPNRWGTIAEFFPQKTANDVSQHYQILLADIAAIEAGFIEPPDYIDTRPESAQQKGKDTRRPANQWTPEEHKRFLEGLQRYGKGDWKSIARLSVKTRSSTQVASHAQKYFLHLEKDANAKNKRKVKSIYDVSLNDQ